MTFARTIRTAIRLKPVLRRLAFAVLLAMASALFFVRSAQNPNPDGQILDELAAFCALGLAIFFAFRGLVGAILHWAEGVPPSLPKSDNPFGDQHFEEAENAARSMRGDKE